MEKIDTNKNQYYIVSLDNGIREEEPITIEVFNNFSDGSQLVQLNKTVFGVLKSYSLSPETMYIDDLEIIKADIAELFDIDHEETKRIVSDDKNVGIFTVLNYSKNMETRISATSILNRIINNINNGTISSEEGQNLIHALNIPSTTKGNHINDKEEINSLINLGMYSLIKDTEMQLGMELNEKNRESIRKNYIRMILFDYIIGRKYRGLDYYLISKVNESGNPILSDAYFSPISISNSLEKDELVGEDEYFINNRHVNKKVLLSVLFDNYYKEIKKMSECLNDASRLYKDAITRIVYNNTDIENAKIFEESIIDNLDNVNALQAEKEKNIDKQQKMNKVERTMATQSLNVKVTAKLDLIQKKYPINPKEHPELLESTKKKNKIDDINLVVEKENKNNSGFASVAILIAIVALICGVGCGIAYMLMTFGS